MNEQRPSGPLPDPLPAGRGKVWFQMLPLLVFAAVDAFVDDPRLSVGAAMLFAVGQLVFTWVTAKKVDRFILFDLVLIGVLGGLSIALNDPLLFKLKPALLEAVSIIFLLVLVFGPDRWLAGYLARYAPNLDADSLATMKTFALGMSGLIALHAGAVVFTALRASDATWAFVSGPGFFLFIAPLFVVVLLRRRAR